MDTQLIKDYLNYGIWIIPLKGKIPTSRCKGWQKRKLPEATILDSFPKSANNIGCVCGREQKILCVDVDAKRDGLRWYQAHKDDLGFHILEHTGGGGFHLIYKYPSKLAKSKKTGEEIPVPSSRDKIADGVEILSDGHYFVTAPSIHPDTNKPYFIENGLTLLDIEEVEEPPKWLLKEAYKHRKESTQAEPIEGASLKAHAATQADIASAVSMLMSMYSVKGNLGDETTFKACCLGRDFNIPQEIWIPYMVKWNETNSDPGWSYERLVKKVQNAYKYGSMDPGNKTAAYDFADTEYKEPAKEPTKKKVDDIEISVGASTAYDHKKPNDVAAKMLSQFFCQRLMYSNQEFFLYDDTDHFWEKISREQLEAMVRVEVRSKNPNANIKNAHCTEIIKALALQVAKARKVELDTRLDGKKGDFIRVQNGIFNLREHKLEPHSKQWFSLTKLPFAIDKEATCPTWHSFLESIFEDDEQSIKALQYWMCYSLSTMTRFQKAALFIGKSRAGKGVITRVMGNLVGETNHTGTSLTKLSDSFGLSPLVGKKLCFLHDAHSAIGYKTDIALENLKSIIGNDSLQIPRKYLDPMELSLNCKITMVTNTMPHFFDSEGAFMKRLVIFKFVKSFAGVEDTMLDEKLLNELPGIFNWVMSVSSQLSELKSLPVSSSQERMVAMYERAMDPIKAFIDDEIIVEQSKQGFISSKELYEAYGKWCEFEDIKKLARERFISKIKERLDDGKQINYKKRRASGLSNPVWGFEGITLSSKEASEFDDNPLH